MTIADLNGTFIVTTDASDVGMGATLSQKQEGVNRIIAYFSAVHSSAERNYSTTEQELLAVIKSVLHFRENLMISKFKLRIDYNPLTYLIELRNVQEQLAQWSLLMQEFAL